MECLKWDLVGHSSRNMEDNCTKSSLNSGDCSYDVLAKIVAAFCPCLKGLPEAKVKRFCLIAVIKEVSKKSSTDFVFWFTLTRSILIKHSKLRQEKYKMFDSRIKMSPGSTIELNPVFKNIKWETGQAAPGTQRYPKFNITWHTDHQASACAQHLGSSAGHLCASPAMSPLPCRVIGT